MKDSKLNHIGLQFFAEPGDPATADPAPTDPPADEPKTDWEAEVKKLQAEMAKLKSANDNLSKENAEQKRTIRASKTAEEQRAEEEKEKHEKMEAELNELRKSAFVSNTAKRLISLTGDEVASTTIAEALYGAADLDAAVDALSKAWAAKEKKLRAEFGKIPAPSAGGSEPTVTVEQFRAMSYNERDEIYRNHPDLYQKLKKESVK